jgi:heme exporter protein A
VIPGRNAGQTFDALRVNDVSRHFGRRRAVSHVSFEAPRHSIIGLLGPNGAGKSTILAMLATLLRPTSGSIRYGSEAASGSGAALRGSIGALGHDLFLYPELTARENLEFFAGLYAVADRKAAATIALERGGLIDRADDPVSAFSRGMRQRLALERALIHNPQLLLLDEPFTGLDDASGSALLTRLRSLRGSGGIVVIATHDLDLAGDLLDRAIFLRDGRVVESADKPAALRAFYRTVMTRTTADATAGVSPPRNN